MTDPRTLAHTDPRALAHEIATKDAFNLCHAPWPEKQHSDLCNRIEFALRTARKEAFERAAMVAESFCDNATLATVTTLPAAIRKLIGEDDG